MKLHILEQRNPSYIPFCLVRYEHKCDDCGKIYTLTAFKCHKLSVGHFTTLSGHFSPTALIFSKHLDSDGHFEMRKVSKSCTNLLVSFLLQKNPDNSPFLVIFFANQLIIEVQTVILRCLVCLNLNWI